MHDPEHASIPGLPRELPTDPVRPRSGVHVARNEHGSCIASTPGFVFAPEFVSAGREALRGRQPPSALPRTVDARPSCESLGTLP